MIGRNIGRFLLQGEDSLMIDAAQCATVRTENTLLHALLLLSSVGFTSVPVLDESSRVAGIITMPSIINGLLDNEDYNWDLLPIRKVKEVMTNNVPRVFRDSPFEDVLHVLVNSNYLCVTERDNTFLGIIARKQLLKRVNRLAHEFELFYEVKERTKDKVKEAPSHDFAEDDIQFRL